jgi:photoactive yellow protein
MTDDLTHLSSAEIDALPFGYIALAPDGTIRKYNRYEADLARKDPNEVLGKNFFREVAPCTQVQEFEGRFQHLVSGELGEPSVSFDFDFNFRHGTQQVRIGMVRSPDEREVIVTVNRVRNLKLPLSADLSHDAGTGRLTDATGAPAVVANADFWLALQESYSSVPAEERRGALLRLGREWGLRQALKVERFTQEEHNLTLREVELQIALGTLSGSIGVLGLGSFEVDLRYRSRGLLLVQHQHSPFAAMLAAEDGLRCPVLAGLHAGFLSYLAGRPLSAREIHCSARPQDPCRILVATEQRLERLLTPVEGSADAALLVTLGVRPAAQTGEGHDD